MTAGVLAGKRPERLITVEKLRRYLPAIGVFLAAIVIWESMVTILDIDRILLPKPSEIAGAFVEEFDIIRRAGQATLFEAFGGFVAGTVLGVSLALVASRWTGLRDGVLPFAIAVNSAPIVALAPITNQWFGITNPVSKMAVVTVMVFFPVMINSIRGLTEVDEDEIELMRSYAASDLSTMRRIRLPNALPYLFSAMKIGATLAVIGAIVAEYFGGPAETLGVYITGKASLGRVPEAWAAVVIGVVIGVGFYLAVVIAERLLMPWHTSFRRTEP